MLDMLRRGYDLEGEQSFHRQMDFIKDAPLLVLDDLGAENTTPWGMEKLIIIVDYRYVNGLPLMVTSNKDLSNLPQDDEHRLGSRLMRAPFSHVVEMQGPEYRVWLKGQAKK
jgi:DNA replication protein DnaC